MTTSTFASLQIQSDTNRRCGTCAFYQVSPLRHQGWCRNPQLHAPQERALVSEDEHRCLKMLTDFWHPSPAVEKKGAGRPRRRSRGPWLGELLGRISLPAVVVYGMVVMVVAIAAVFMFSTQTTRATNDRPTQKVEYGTAKLDFWLRDDSRSNAPKKSIVLIGTTLELVNSKAGEVLDESIENNSKWYEVKVSPSGEKGWVYGGWLKRTVP